MTLRARLVSDPRSRLWSRLACRLACGLAAVLVVGAASGCPTVDQGEPPVAPEACRPDPALFESTIWPQAIAVADESKSCVAKAGCHARETGRSALRLIAAPANAVDFQQNYDAVTRFLNCSTPSASPFISKPTGGGDPHAGGDLWTEGEEPELTVERWISGTP
jgi:hypothetical protein